MAQIPTKSLPRLYADLMRQLKRRIEGINRALVRAKSEPDAKFQALEMEFCYLQIRMSIELIALATLAAHNEIEGFRRKDLMKAWHASNLISQLQEMSDDAFPRPIRTSDPVDGVANLIIDQHEEQRASLLKIYHLCGERLHTGQLRTILTKGGKAYPVSEVREWTNAIVSLVNQHVILMPSGKRMMIAFMRHNATDDVHCFFTDIQPGDVVHITDEHSLGC